MPGLLDDAYMDAIKRFEGYQPRASWDYAQYTNGYGTRAAHAGEVIDKDTAEQRFNSEIGKATDAVDKAFPQLPEGARAALTSLTFNAGPGWIGGGLGNAVRTGDWATARGIFQQYNHAGGQVLPGLVNRRAQEGAWLVGAQGPQAAAEGPATGSPAGLPVQADALPATQQATPPSGGLLGSQVASAASPTVSGQQANPFASLGQIGMGMMQGPTFQPMAPMPAAQPAAAPPPVAPLQLAQLPSLQLQRPQIDYSGLQRLLSGQRGFG